MNKQKKIKIVQVGIGRMGNYWLKTIMESKEVELIGVVEINDQLIERRIKEYSIDRKDIFKSLPEAIETTKPDGILNVTPPNIHEEIDLISLQFGVPVLSEKPLSDNLESAKKIVDESNKTGVLCMVAQDYRYTKQIQTLKKILLEERLGKPEAVFVNFFKKLPLKDILEYCRKMSHLLITDMSIHHFDAMRLLFKSELNSVWARGFNPSWSWLEKNSYVIAVLELENGIKISYNASFSSLGKETSWIGDWRIECEKGVIVMSKHSSQTGYLPGLEGETIELFTIDKKQIKVEMENLEFEKQAYLLHEFYRALTEGIKPATICQDNIKTMNIVINTIKSIETGLEVRC